MRLSIQSLKLISSKVSPMKDSGLQVLDCGFLVSGTWISDFSRSRIPDSLSFTTDSEDHDFRLYKQKFPGFRKSGLLYMGRYIVDCIWAWTRDKKTCFNRVHDMTCFAAKHLTTVFDQRVPLVFHFSQLSGIFFAEKQHNCLQKKFFLAKTNQVDNSRLLQTWLTAKHVTFAPN